MDSYPSTEKKYIYLGVHLKCLKLPILNEQACDFDTRRIGEPPTVNLHGLGLP